MAQASSATPSSNNRAGFFRRLGAWVYDLLIIIAIMLLATLVGILVFQLLLHFNLASLPDGIEDSEYLRNNWFFKVYLVFCYFGFYVYFWRRGGQTAGMKTWRLKLQNTDGSRLSVTQCIIRLLTAGLGLSNLTVFLPWCKKRGLQDICAKCELIVLSKEENKHVNWKGYM
ncbi:RDD family protein [Catenovulum maritimum]|uniref:RDD domain-containing protein n=1 Tax=Catenovulum maritimum TaxID=1513271 RepID=A0A0J8GS79_9ALTE|nr:RDD family protein [Catenovulum maritimum]KMT65660.1 hypothetical protein XM47_08170 [Catenovulum maritimum]